MNKITVALLRVSTDEQKTDSQRSALMGEIERRRLKIIELKTFLADYQVYSKQENLCVVVEDQVSGRTEEREGYQWVMGQIRGGWVKSVLVFKHDRIGRSNRNNEEFLQACLNRKVELYSVIGQCDIDTSDGRFMFRIVSAMAERESEAISERVKAGIAAKKKAAEKAGIPYRHGGTSRGWWSKKVIKLLPRVYEYIDEGFSNYHIKRMLGLNYRTIRKIRENREKEKLTRKQMNTKVYGKSNAVI